MPKVETKLTFFFAAILLMLIFSESAFSANQQINNSAGDPNDRTTQSETSIAVDPTEKTIVIGFNDSTNFFSDGSFTGYSYSTDGGMTYTDAGVLGPVAGGKNQGDPVLVSDSQGTFYFATLAADANANSFIGVAKSTSTAPTVTFAPPVLIPGLDPNGFQDKEWIAVDTTGSQFDGNVYVAWTEFPNAAPTRILFSRSSDGGNTYSSAIDLSGSGTSRSGAFPVVGPGGDVYMTWIDRTDPVTGIIKFRKCSPGASECANLAEWGPEITVANFTKVRDSNATSNCGRPALNGSIRVHNFPSMAVDLSNTSTRGTIYIAFNGDPDGDQLNGDDSDIFMTRSTDGGTTWSPTINVNKPGPGVTNPDPTLNDNWFPDVAVASPNGHIKVIFYDRRLDPTNNFQTDLFEVISKDGGQTWTNQRMTSTTFGIPQLSPNFDSLVARCYMGDYNQIIATKTKFYLSWADNRNTVTTPGFPNGRPDPDIFTDTQNFESIDVEPAMFEYAAKLVCGRQKDPQDMRLARGFYATAINIHNPNKKEAKFTKHLALTFPPGEQKPGEVKEIATDILRYDEALAVDCMDIKRKVYPNGFPAPYIEGFVVIQGNSSLDVTAVYSTASLDQQGQVTHNSSIDVEQIPERNLRQQ